MRSAAFDFNSPVHTAVVVSSCPAVVSPRGRVIRALVSGGFFGKTGENPRPMTRFFHTVFTTQNTPRVHCRRRRWGLKGGVAPFSLVCTSTTRPETNYTAWRVMFARGFFYFRFPRVPETLGRQKNNENFESTRKTFL